LKNFLPSFSGAIQSQQILMLSGIGPKYHLNQLGIPVIADLPVGYNLKDHILLSILAMVKRPHHTNPVLSSNPSEMNIANLYQLYANKTGVLSQFPYAFTYYSTKYNDDNTWPNAVIFALSTTSQFNPIFRKQLYNNKHNKQFESADALVFVPVLARIKSVGTIKLNSDNPFDPPLIDTNTLSDNFSFNPLNA
jgi:choline dehydrogenase-like flavoprotein